MNLKKKWKQFFTLTRREDRGFTLVELIVVIAVLAILGGVAVPAYSGYVEKANRSADDQLLATINKAYAVACLRNGKDMASLTTATMPLKEADRTVNLEGVDPYKADFTAYYAGNETSAFKYYDSLRFDKAKGIFVGTVLGEILEVLQSKWPNSSFYSEDDGGKNAAEKILGAFNGIGKIFAPFGENGDITLNDWFPGLSSEFASALKFDEMIAGINVAMRGEESANGKGNAAVMYFATDAANQSEEDLKNSVDYFINVLSGKGKNEDGELVDVTVDTSEVAEYIRSTLTPTEQESYKDLSDRELVDLANTWVTDNFGLGLTYEYMARMEKAAKQYENGNTAGISSLGAMYALAAGYYEYIGEEPPANAKLGTFDSVMSAMSNPTSFNNYYTTKGAADLEAYRTFMGYLSTGSFDMDDEDLFTNAGLDYISEALGFDDN